MRDHEFLLAKLLAKNAKAIGRSFLDSVIYKLAIDGASRLSLVPGGGMPASWAEGPFLLFWPLDGNTIEHFCP